METSSTTIPLLPPQGSTFAWDVDMLLLYITVITAGTGLAVFVVLICFCFAFARKKEGEETPRILGSHMMELAWTVTPLLIFLSFFAWGVVVYNKLLHPPADAAEVYVVGKQWMWKIQHPNGVREINQLHLPVNKPVKLTMISEDVIHDFGVPAFRTKVDVLPGRFSSIWYHPNKVGTYHLFCDQYCGQGHSKMIGSIVVMEQDDYDDWLQGKTTELRENSVDGSLAWEGRKLYLKLQCISCHSNNTHARAPVLENLYGTRVPLQGGGHVTADEAYIRESILKPKAKVVEGWQPIMPTYQGQVTEEDLIKVIAYIKSLRPGTTPDRTEQFPAPVGAPVEPSPGETKKP